MLSTYSFRNKLQLHIRIVDIAYHSCSVTRLNINSNKKSRLSILCRVERIAESIEIFSFIYSPTLSVLAFLEKFSSMERISMSTFL